MKLQRVIILAAAAACLAAPASATTFYFYVNGAFGGAPTGACATPFTRIEDAIVAAKAQVTLPGDTREIRIAGGTYNERTLTIDFSDVTLKGGYDPASFAAGCDVATTEASRNVLTRITVIDGQQLDRIFDIECVRDPVSTLCTTVNTNIAFDGITFRNGRPARTFDPIDPTRLGGAGGAMMIINAEVRVTDSIFEANTTREHFFGGGAIYIVGYYTGANAQFNNAILDLNGGNVFRNNSTGDGVTASGWGGAIFAVDGNVSGVGTVQRRTTVNVRTVAPITTQNQFVNNTANGGGTVSIFPNCPNNCLINNPAPQEPLTLTCVTPCVDDGDGDNLGVCYRPNYDCNSDGTPESCVSGALGGAIFLQNVRGTIDGVRFEGNVARARTGQTVDRSGIGGAIAIRASVSPNQANPAITNNMFLTNTAQSGGGTANGCGWYNAVGGAIYAGGNGGFDSEMRNNVFRNNRALGTGNPSALAVGWGGAVMLYPQNQPVIDNNQFVDAPGGPNQAVGGGGNPFSAWGGGMAILGGQPIVSNNIFRGNFVQTGQAGNPAPVGSGYGGGLMGLQLIDTYPVIAGNTLESNAVRNLGTPPNAGLALLGGGAMLQMGSADGVFADNIVRNNTATTLGGPLSFAGIVLEAENFGNDMAPASASEPLVQNNLITGNLGIGLTMLGDGANPAAHAWSGRIFNNTIADNTTGGVAMNRADNAIFDSNIIVRNDAAGVALGDIFDDFIGATRIPSVGQEVTYNDIGVLPPDPPDFVAAATDGLLTTPPTDWVGVDPIFATGAQGSYYLAQVGEEPAPPYSPLVDAGAIKSASRNFGGPRALVVYDLNGDTFTDTMRDRTTRSQSQGPDLCFLDIGFHYRMGLGLVDTDGDGMPDSFEDTNANGIWDIASETNFQDRDTDNDGVLDGDDCGADVDGDGTPAALDCDADGDGLTDGLEQGVTVPDVDTVSTNTCVSATPCGTVTQQTFTADANGATRTDPLDPDSDGSGEWDGCEDTNRDGACVPCGQPCAGSNEQSPVNTLAGQADDDADSDCMQASFERSLGLNPLDTDTDDDGISDGAEYGFGNPAPTAEAASEPTLCDTDRDGLTDGLEQSQLTGCDTDADGDSDFSAYYRAGDVNGDTVNNEQDCMAFVPISSNIDPGGRWIILGTDTTTPCAATGGQAYVADADRASQTFTYCSNPTDPTFACEGRDTDGDTCLDGVEDANFNGRVDPPLETDPNVDDCVGAGHPLRINEEISRLLDPAVIATWPCGPKTLPTMDQVIDARGSCVEVDACIPGFSIEMVTTCTAAGSVPAIGPEIGSPVTIPTAATPNIGCPLTFFEVDGCDYDLWVLKNGNDIVLEAR